MSPKPATYIHPKLYFNYLNLLFVASYHKPLYCTIYGDPAKNEGSVDKVVFFGDQLPQAA